MTRISKNPEDRRNELLNAAEELFINEGYIKTAVSDIVKRISVAQGTFYYYFKSKEEIFVALFGRQLQEFIENLNNKISIKGSALEKLKEFIILDFEAKINSKNYPLVKQLHEEQNTSLHQKVTVAKIQKLNPILTAIILKGIEENQFSTDYPEELSEFLLISSNFNFDPSIFNLEEKKYPLKLEALLNIIEKALDLPKGSLNIREQFSSYL